MGIPPQTKKAQKDALIVGCSVLILSIVLAFSSFCVLCVSGIFFVLAVTELIFLPPTLTAVGTLVLSPIAFMTAFYIIQFVREIVEAYIDGNEDTDDV